MTHANERRTPKENRIPFDAFVEVGGLTGETFKARAIDLSAGGIHLQATNLPEIGTPLSCRFDSASDTVVCEGEVVWRRRSSRGGDFGLRFRSLDTESERVLRELCAVDYELGAGARVRLHLKGLAQPLHARVVQSNAQGVVTASELSFLKAGTECTLEERDTDTRAGATLEDVRVNVDPKSGTPELTLTMGWGAKEKEAARSANEVPQATRLESQPRAAAPVARHTTPDDKTPLDSVPPVAFDANAEHDEELRDSDAPNAPSVAPLSLSASPDEEDDLAWREQIDSLMSGVRRVREAFGRKSSAASARAQGAQERPRRVTAAPPYGALRSEGKHVLRRQAPSKDAAQTANTTPAEWVTKNKRALALGSAVSLSVMLGAFALSRGDSPAVAGTTDSSGAVPGTAAPAAQPGFDVVQPAPAVPGSVAPYDPAAAVAATPYAAPGTPGVDTSATPWAAQAGAPGTAGAYAPYVPPAIPTGQVPNAWAPTTPVAAAAPLPPARSTDDFSPAPSSGSDREERSAPRRPHAVHSFGQGGIASGKTLRLHMSAPIEQIQGEHTPTGFTVDLPNVRATEPAGPLASQDPRIESMRVRNTDKRAELVVEFKDGVPNYLVRAKGDVLEIVLADKGASSGSADSERSDRADRSAPRVVRKPSLERVRTRRRHR